MYGHILIPLGPQTYKANTFTYRCEYKHLKKHKGVINMTMIFTDSLRRFASIYDFASLVATGFYIQVVSYSNFLELYLH